MVMVVNFLKTIEMWWGEDVVAAVLEFFRTGEILKVLNHTVITVIPKSSHATSVGDYRPIAGCNTVYKVI